MGKLKTVRQGIDTVARAGVSAGVSVLWWPPDRVDEISSQKFLALWPMSLSQSRNEVMGAGFDQEESDWMWMCIVGCSYADSYEKALDEIDDILADIDDNIAGQRPITTCGKIDITDHHTIEDTTENHILVRQEWVHERAPG